MARRADTVNIMIQRGKDVKYFNNWEDAADYMETKTSTFKAAIAKKDGTTNSYKGSLVSVTTGGKIRISVGNRIFDTGMSRKIFNVENKNQAVETIWKLYSQAISLHSKLGLMSSQGISMRKKMLEEAIEVLLKKELTKKATENSI